MATSAITTAIRYAVMATAGTVGEAAIMATGATSTSTGTPTSTGAGRSPAMKSISTVAALSVRTIYGLHQRPSGWQPDQRHRRGQAYPEAVQQRLGRTQQPALAGQRLGAAQTLPAEARGFDRDGQRPAAGTLPAERRPSSADIQKRLAQKPGTQEPFANKLGQPKPAARDVQERLGQGSRDNALQGIKNSGQASRLESKRGTESRKPVAATRDIQTRKPAGGERVQRTQQSAVERKPQMAQRQAAMPKSAERSQALAGRERTQQQRNIQHRTEAAKPNAFEGSRNVRATQNASQRGAFSQQRSAHAGNLRTSGGGGRPSGGGGLQGGGGRSGGGGMRGGGGRAGGGGMRGGGGGRRR